MNYLFGFLLISIQKTVISFANIFDGQLSRNTFKSVWSLVTLNGLLLIPVMPILIFILKPGLITLNQLFLILLVAAIEFFYQIPYYKALRYADTSAVISMFSIGKFFVPVFAYYITNEHLSLLQYIGFGIIVLSSLAASLNHRTLRINKALYYMLPVSIIIAFEAVLEKYGIDKIGWNTFYFWSLLLSIPFYLTTLLLLRSVKKEVISFFKKPLKKSYLPLYGQNIATWLSGGLGSFALSLLPVTIIKAFGSFQSLFVHLLATRDEKYIGIKAGEKFSYRKIIIFFLVGVGIILTLK